MMELEETKQEFFEQSFRSDAKGTIHSRNPYGPHRKGKRCICGTHSIGIWEKKNRLRRIWHENSKAYENNVPLGKAQSRYWRKWESMMLRLKGGYKTK